jgi:hypothetical protein
VRVIERRRLLALDLISSPGRSRSGILQAHACTDPPLGIVRQLQLTAVILHDLLHDRQPQAGALAACGHVGLGEAVAAFARQAACRCRSPTTTNRPSPRSINLTARPRRAAAWRMSLGLAPVDRVERVLQAGWSAPGRPGAGRRAAATDGPAAGLARSRHRRGRSSAGRSRAGTVRPGSRRAERRRRHARESRELVDHAADVADLPDDRVGALLEGLGIRRDLASGICASGARPKAGWASAGS